VAGGVAGSNVQLYMTGSGNTLWTYTDTAAAASVLSGTLSAFTSLAIASGSTAFRGVVLVPTVVPEPSATLLLAAGAVGGVAAWRQRRKGLSPHPPVDPDVLPR
jgi:hypothetical protein